jgi:hypothetical protein
LWFWPAPTRVHASYGANLLHSVQVRHCCSHQAACCSSWASTSIVHSKIRLIMQVHAGAKRQVRSNSSSGCCALLASAGSLTASLRFFLSHLKSMMVRLVLVSPLATNGLHMLRKHDLDRCVLRPLDPEPGMLTDHGLGRVKINTSNELYFSTALY